MAAPSQPSVSVVVPTNNRSRRLSELLRSLRAQTLPGDRFEVVVVDNASRDDTPEVLAREREGGGLRLTVLRRAADTGGPAAPRNEGWRAARSDLVAFTDDDCVADPGWLEAGLRAASDHPQAVVQGRTEPNPEEVGELGPFSRTVRVDRLGPYYQATNIFYPRPLLERLGGFDEERRARSGSAEDTDLAYRALELGAGMVFAPDALVFHAVNQLGPLGKLKVAARWSDSMEVYARFPSLRANVFSHKIFWKHSHFLLSRALLALLLPRRLRPLGLLLVKPYLSHVLERIRLDNGSGAALVAYYALHDLIELAAVARGAVRYRQPFL